MRKDGLDIHCLALLHRCLLFSLYGVRAGCGDLNRSKFNILRCIASGRVTLLIAVALLILPPLFWLNLIEFLPFSTGKFN